MLKSIRGCERFFMPLCMVLFFSAAVVQAAIALFQTPFANGWDAYYYLVQIKSLLQEGRMHSADYSLVYPLLLFFNCFTSDAVLAYKITAAFVAGLYPLALFIAGYRIATGNKLLVGIAVAALGLFGPAEVFVNAQFLKNSLGMALLIFFIAALPRGKWYFLLPLFAATFITHRLTGAVAAIFLLLHFADRKHWKYLIAAIAAAILALVFVPGVMNFFDLARFKNEFQGVPQWAPYSFVMFYGLEKMDAVWLAGISVLFIVLIWWTIAEFKRFRRRPNAALRISFWVVALVLLFPFFRFNAEGPALRFFLSFLMLAPVCLAFIAGQLRKLVPTILALVFLAASVFSVRAYDPLHFDPPYELYRAISANAMQHLDKRQTKLVIAHKALAEYFTFSEGLDAMPWNPDEGSLNDTIARISCGIEKWEFASYLDSSQLESIREIGLQYSVLPESVWEEFFKKVPVSDSSLYGKLHSWENPWQCRPSFITAKRK
jgi:hypothetical protein